MRLLRDHWPHSSPKSQEMLNSVMPALDVEKQHGPLPQNLNKDPASMSCHLTAASPPLAPLMGNPHIYLNMALVDGRAAGKAHPRDPQTPPRKMPGMEGGELETLGGSPLCPPSWGPGLWDDPLPSGAFQFRDIKASAPRPCAHLHTWGPGAEALWGSCQPCESLSWGGPRWGTPVLGREAAGVALPPPGVPDT